MTKITVQDNGAGMSKDMLAHFGQLGYRDKATSHLPGSGIGLASSIQLVNDRGGRLEAASEGPKKGSTVFFTLPCACVDCTTALSVPVVRRKMNKSNMSVLVVDDAEVAYKMLTSLCKRMGIKNIEVACTGEEAVAKFEKCPRYALILMDDHLGSGIDGKEATRRIRQHAKGREVVIFSTSGSADEDSKEMFRACGMDGLLLKPPRGELLTELLERHFEFMPGQALSG
jgi:CheY-like chemotaxis protein